MKIPLDETLRYAGWRGQESDAETLSALNRMCDSVLSTAEPRGVWAKFTLSDGKLKEAGYPLSGFDILRHLSGYDEVILMAVTLGLSIDRKSTALQRNSARDALIFDAAASAAIEAFADEFTEKISAEIGRPVGRRFSPGYGDFPLETQRDLAALLQTDKRIGLTVNREYNMIPLKSITALAPVGKNCGRTSLNKCADCPKTDCAFRTEKK